MKFVEEFMNSVKECKSLNSLFELWKNKQANEDFLQENCSVRKTSFCFDGIINQELYGANNKIKLLFIAKEANAGGKSLENVIDDTSGEFWLQNVSKNKINGKMFSNRIAMMSNAFYNNDFDKIDKDYENLQYIAFMNINKRGGYSSSNNKNIQNYAEKYAEFIAKEIEILSPDVIICCGRVVYNIYNNCIRDKFDKEYRVYWAYHPSCRVSNKKYLHRFRDNIIN